MNAGDRFITGVHCHPPYWLYFVSILCSAVISLSVGGLPVIFFFIAGFRVLEVIELMDN